jgi:hypothetical protein
MLIALSVGLLAFGVYLWQLSVPEFVGFYDSGVYLAATIHLVSGALPYKDFVFVNPPGLLIVLSPIGVISRIFGSHDGLIIARIANALVTAVDVSLLAWLVRHRGRVAMVISGVGLALLPVALIVSSGVRLEPYCLLLILLGALVICSGDFGRPVLSKRSLILAGLFFGLAASIKLWAFFPFVAAVICLTPQYRNRLLLFVGAAAGGFVVPVLPFFLIAPRSFLSQVFAAQFLAKPNLAQATKAIWRLSDLTGFQSSSLAPNPRETVVVWLVFCCLVIAGYWRRFEHEMVDRFLLASFVITGCALLAAPASSGYYFYFSAPFLVGVVAVTAARLGHHGRALTSRIRVSREVRAALRLLSGVASVILVFALTLYSTTFFTNFAWGYGMYFPWLSTIATKVPPGSCVISDYVVFQLETNRFAGNSANCPDVIDPYGVWQTWNNDYADPPPAFAALWKSYFQQANYVVLNSPGTVMIPWDRSLRTWFQSNYYMISDSHGVYIYANDAKGRVST